MTVAKTKAEGFYAMTPIQNACTSTKLQYFGPIPPKVYEYRIGGYQVCDKWLKDRKGHQIKDFRIYCRLVTALGHTITIQEELDDVVFRR